MRQAGPEGVSGRTLTYVRATGYACFLLIGLLAFSTALLTDLFPTIEDQGLWLRYLEPVYILAASALFVGLVLSFAARWEPVLLGLCCANLLPPMLTVLEITVPGSVTRALWVFQVLSDVALPLRWFWAPKVRASRLHER